MEIVIACTCHPDNNQWKSLLHARVTLTTTSGSRYCMHVNNVPAVTLTTTNGSRYCMHVSPWQQPVEVVIACTWTRPPLSPWQQPIEIVIACTWRNGKQPPEYLGLLLVSCYHCSSKPNGRLLLSVDTAASSYTVADFAVSYCTPPGCIGSYYRYGTVHCALYLTE